MKQMNEQQQVAHQAIAEIAADLGVAFTLEAVADAFEQAARSRFGAESSDRSDNLNHAVQILRNLAGVLE